MHCSGKAIEAAVKSCAILAQRRAGCSLSRLLSRRRGASPASLYKDILLVEARIILTMAIEKFQHNLPD